MQKELKRGKKITAGKLRKFLDGCRKGMSITFGAPRANERPLVFGQFKRDEQNKILFLNLERHDENSNPIPEWATRITVKRLLDNIDAAQCDDDWKVEISGEIFKIDRIESIQQVLAFNIGRSNRMLGNDHFVV